MSACLHFRDNCASVGGCYALIIYMCAGNQWYRGAISGMLSALLTPVCNEQECGALCTRLQARAIHGSAGPRAHNSRQGHGVEPAIGCLHLHIRCMHATTLQKTNTLHDETLILACCKLVNARTAPHNDRLWDTPLINSTQVKRVEIS